MRGHDRADDQTTIHFVELDRGPPHTLFNLLLHEPTNGTHNASP